MVVTILLSLLATLSYALFVYHWWHLMRAKIDYENTLDYEPPIKKIESSKIINDENFDDLEEIKPVKLEDGTIISSKNKIEL